MSTRTAQLYKGVIWITDLEDIENGAICFRIPVNQMGVIDSSYDKSGLNSKKGDNYNHEKLWKSLDHKTTRNQRFDYYPRGRVEIRNGRATIYASPHICTDDVLRWIIERFGLRRDNGIQIISVIPDYSTHYLCYLDKTR